MGNDDSHVDARAAVRGNWRRTEGTTVCNAAYSNRDVSAHANNVGTTHSELARTRTTWEQRTTEEIRAIGVSAYAHSGIGLFVVKHLPHKLEPDAFAKA
jgi:hypothetical protein